MKLKYIEQVHHVLLDQLRSLAIQPGFENLSQTIVTSDGPAIIPSIPTSPKTSFLAAATYELPGPTILSTFLIFLVP